jgi:nucleoside-diphosphate-sugar epimerase
MRILLTGATGFVGRFVLRKLLEENDTLQIILLLRGKKGKSARERFESEISTDSLFISVSDALGNVEILEGDLSQLDALKWSGDTIIHCAANVKTLDTYTNLYSDNVLGVQQLCDAAAAWNVSRLILLSTCYVHPRGSVGKPELLANGLPREVFTTDYTYTKYLGEHVAAGVAKAGNLKISILRLSCVGAPAGWLDAHPTPSAMAHLGILSLILRGRLTVVRLPSTSQLSTVPVDLVASQIVDHLKSSDAKGILQIRQLCASPDSIWNLSLPRLCETAKRLAPKLEIEMIDCEESELQHALEARWGLSKWTPSGYKSLRFHKEINDFIGRFADGQRFETSIAGSAWLDVPQETIYEQTCMYVARGIHQFKLEKGVPMSVLDKFWGQMPSNIISGIFKLQTPLSFASKEEAESRLFDMISAYRPAFQKIPLESTQRYNAAYAPRISWATDVSGGLEVRTSLSVPLEVEILGSHSEIQALRIYAHHGIGDGLAFLPLVARISSLDKPSPLQCLPPPAAKPRPLAWSTEFQCFVLYLAFFVKLCFSSVSKHQGAAESVHTQSLHLQKCKGETFTCSILDKLYPGIRQALGKDQIVYCVPAMSESQAQRGFKMPQNAFVPVLLPWGSESNALSQLFLHSKAVRFISWLLSYTIGLTEFVWLRDFLMDRIDCVVSSVYGSDQAIPAFESVYFHAPTPAQIPFTASFMTLGQQTHVTVASRTNLPAVKLMKHLQS